MEFAWLIVSSQWVTEVLSLAIMRKKSTTNDTKCNFWFMSFAREQLSINFQTTSTSACFPASNPSESCATILLFPLNSISFSISWVPLLKHPLLFVHDTKLPTTLHSPWCWPHPPQMTRMKSKPCEGLITLTIFLPHTWNEKLVASYDTKGDLTC